jgi:hypothetical protein
MKAPRTPPPARQFRAALDDIANALQRAAGLAPLLRSNTQTTAADAVALEAAIGRAVSALKGIQPSNKRPIR